MKKFMLAAILILSLSTAYAKDNIEINTTLMRSTFMLSGQGSTGTAFIIGRPSKVDKTKGYYVLVTAAHVLKAMHGERAVLNLRRRSGELFTKIPYPISIRRGTEALWTEHPHADVAVMYVALPKDIDIALLPTNLLATDDILKKFEIHPGDRLSCLGFPLMAEANEAGFPILRSGQISSYPLVPMSAVKTILYDFNVFEGNSGGPVYFVDNNRTYGGATKIGRVRFLMGLVSEQKFAEEQVKSLREVRKERYQLELAVVIPAQFILDTINRLPEPQE
jgi:V8-like Glu-specific endopeptidase